MGPLSNLSNNFLVVEFGYFAIENLKKNWKFVCLGFKHVFSERKMVTLAKN
jgi:hypothetical protein